jgi:hypothetical protein
MERKEKYSTKEKMRERGGDRCWYIMIGREEFKGRERLKEKE